MSRKIAKIQGLREEQQRQPDVCLPRCRHTPLSRAFQPGGTRGTRGRPGAPSKGRSAQAPPPSRSRQEDAKSQKQGQLWGERKRGSFITCMTNASLVPDAPVYVY